MYELQIGYSILCIITSCDVDYMVSGSGEFGNLLYSLYHHKLVMLYVVSVEGVNSVLTVSLQVALETVSMEGMNSLFTITRLWYSLCHKL